MRNCSECGRELAEGELVCPVCGSKVTAEAETPAPENAAVPPVVSASSGEPETAVAASAPGDPVCFCPQCGAPQEEGSTFCAACGAHIAEDGASEAAPAAKKRKHFGIIASGVAAVAVVALVVWLIGRLLGGSPNAKFVAHHRDMIADLMDKELGDTVENFNRLATLSTDMTITVEAPDSSELDSVLEDAAITLQVDCNKTSAKLGGALVMDDENVVSGMVVYNKGKVGFRLPELDETYYTADLTELVENLSGEQIKGLDKLEIPQIPEKTLKKVAGTYFGIVAQAVTKENVSAEKDSFKLSHLGKDRVEGTKYEYTPGAEDVENMLEKLADALEKDKDIQTLVKEFLGGDLTVINEALAEAGGEYDTLEEALQEGLSELADNLRDSAEEAGEAVEDSDFTWTLWVGKGGVYKGELAADDALICYERTKNGVALWVEEPEYDYQQDILVLEYEKDGKLYDGTYTVSGGTTMEFRDVDTSKRSALGYYYGKYTVSQYGTDVLEMEVKKGANGGTDHIMELGDLSNLMSYSYYYYDSSAIRAMSGMSVTINTTDKKSSLKTPGGKKVDVTQYDEDEFEDLFRDLADEFSDVAQELGRSFGNSFGGNSYDYPAPTAPAVDYSDYYGDYDDYSDYYGDYSDYYDDYYDYY